MDKEKLIGSRSDGGAIKKTLSYDYTRSVGTRPSASGIYRYSLQTKTEERKYDFRDYIIKEEPKVQIHKFQQENKIGDSEKRAKLAEIHKQHGHENIGEICKTGISPDQWELTANLYNTLDIGEHDIRYRLNRPENMDIGISKEFSAEKSATQSMKTTRERTQHSDVLHLNDVTTPDKEPKEKSESSEKGEKRKEDNLESDGLDEEDIIKLAQACASELQEEIIEKNIEAYLVSRKTMHDVNLDQTTTNLLDVELRPTQFLDLDVTGNNEDKECTKNLTHKKKAPLWAMLFAKGTKAKVRHDRVKKVSNEDLEDEAKGKDKNTKLKSLQRALQRLRLFGTNVRRRFKLLKNRILGRY